jgi:hypothetical protein
VSIPAIWHATGARWSGNRRGLALETSRAAWNSLTLRHWLIAAGVGVLVGTVDATWMLLYASSYVYRYGTARWFDFLAILLTHFVLLMAGVACALALAIAVLHEISLHAAIRPRDVVLTTLAVAAFGSLVVDPIAVVATGVVHAWLHFPSPMFTAGAGDWLEALSRMYSNSGEKVLTFATTGTLSAVYYFKDSRTTDALAVAQLGLLRAQKRRLTEELRSAQAALDPEFLFATFDEVDRRLESEPQVAQRLLEALIRYLRAALPGNEQTIGTLGQQATLVRAWLEIEAIRSAGRLQSDIELPSELDRRPFAPALILPLVTLVTGDAARSGRDTQVKVSASVVGGRLTVEIGVIGCNPPGTTQQDATLASLRQRLGALYGSSAELSFATMPRGSTAKIVIDDPGTL